MGAGNGTMYVFNFLLSKIRLVKLFSGGWVLGEKLFLCTRHCPICQGDFRLFYPLSVRLYPLLLLYPALCSNMQYLGRCLSCQPQALHVGSVWLTTLSIMPIHADSILQRIDKLVNMTNINKFNGWRVDSCIIPLERARAEVWHAS